jgi:hypothetical protein
MSMSALGWIISLGSGATLAGYVALLICAPQAALAIERIALDLLSRVLATRLGCAALAALVVGSLAFVCGDHSGAARVQAEWDAAEHAAVAAGQDARAEAEQEIPPLADATPPSDETAPLQDPGSNPKAAADACPPARPRTYDDRLLRHDPHNRDHR